MSQCHTRGEWLFASFSRALHHANQTRPVDRNSAFQLARTGIAQSRKIVGIECVTDIIQSAPASSAKHLEKLVGFHLPFEISGEVAPVGNHDRSHGKID